MEPKRNGPALDRFTAVTAGPLADSPGLRVVSTRDHAEIQRWAAAHSAQPASGEAGASGAAVRSVNDTGAGIRFNFPGFSPFRPITWDAWFENFEQHDLTFVFEETDVARIAERARERSEARHGGAGDPKGDWFEAERDLQASTGATAPVRYRLIKTPAPQR